MNPPDPDGPAHDFEVYVITGGTRGIGAAAARGLSGVPGRALVLAHRSDSDTAAEVADAVVWLLSEQASYVIGSSGRVRGTLSPRTELSTGLSPIGDKSHACD
ncbi:MAG: hypothetical protein L0G99_00255 [Propionibacteriales bacterium]|nr:hypothetical protein [Propionibacteriales bacterium]